MRFSFFIEATTPAQLPAPNKLLDIDAPKFFTPNPALVGQSVTTAFRITFTN